MDITLPVVGGTGWILPVLAVVGVILAIRWVRSWFF